MCPPGIALGQLCTLLIFIAHVMLPNLIKSNNHLELNKKKTVVFLKKKMYSVCQRFTFKFLMYCLQDHLNNCYFG